MQAKFDHFISAPDFVRTLEDENYVYFFFREQAVEYINCGKVFIYLCMRAGRRIQYPRIYLY